MSGKAGESVKQKCSKKIFSGARGDMGGHMCSLKAIVESDGEWYCRIHDPLAVANRSAAQHSRYEAERDWHRKKCDIQAAKDAVVEAAKAWAVGRGLASTQRIADAVEKLNALENANG